MDDLAGIGVENAHRGLRRIGSDWHDALIDGERPHGRAHIAAIAIVIDAGVLDADLGECVIDIGIVARGFGDHADFRQRRHPTAHAVELTAIRIR